MYHESCHSTYSLSLSLDLSPADKIGLQSYKAEPVSLASTEALFVMPDARVPYLAMTR